MTLVRHDGGVRALFAADLTDQTLGLAWLGQAGFALRFGAKRVLIDPYLSDHLAIKYAGTAFPHTRLMSPPVLAGELRDLDLVLCSHRHGDHMDPGSLAILAARNACCRFVIPRAEVAAARAIGLDADRLIPVNDGDALCLLGALEIHAIASAHETRRVNEQGEHHFLGFIMRFAGKTLYHPGDCVIYEGLAERLRQWRVDLALLPVNGHSAYLGSRGVPGNMDFHQAATLCLAAGIPAMIPHHFGMFAFNTVERSELQSRIDDLDAARLSCTLPLANEYSILA